MKKVIASAGMVALGAVSAQAAYAPGMSSMEASKNWGVSLAVRGFYDDNYNARSDSNLLAPAVRQDDSFGIELRPSVNVNLPLDQTLFKASYTYSYRWFEGRSTSRDNDQAHIANLLLDHAFTASQRVTVTDAFTYSNEPQLGSGVLTQRSNRNNFRNRAAINLHSQWSEKFGTILGYENGYYDYKDPGYSSTLDRMEHLIIINARYLVLPQTVAVLGYQFGIVDYSHHDIIGVVGPTPIFSDDRNSTSHYIYGGVDQTFTPELTGHIRAGAQRISFDSSAVGNGDDWSPYVDGSLNYAYMAGGTVTLGGRYERRPTDVAGGGGVALNLTSDSDNLVGYLSIAHEITPDFTVKATGTIQNSQFNGGTVDGKDELVYSAGLSCAYQINPYLAAEAGYNFDMVDPDFGPANTALQISREYTRNRVYLGLRASY